MLPMNVLTLVNGSSLVNLPLKLPPNQIFEYQARFLPAGPDLAVEITATEIRTYIDGVLCAEENAFTVFAENYRTPLRRARKSLNAKKSETLVLTGRWYIDDVDKGIFDAFVLHIVGANADVRSMRYDLEIFDNDYHQSAKTFAVINQIDAATLQCLQSTSEKMIAPVQTAVTLFGVPETDGVAWLPDNPSLPAIFHRTSWPDGLPKELWDETIKLDAKVHHAEFNIPAVGPITLKTLMANQLPLYFSQIMPPNGDPYDPVLVYYDETQDRDGDIQLTATKEIKGVTFASEWTMRGGFSLRVLV